MTSARLLTGAGLCCLVLLLSAAWGLGAAPRAAAGEPGPPAASDLSRPQAPAGAGELDPNFGASGRVTTTIGLRSAVAGLALQPDGRIVTAGWASPGSAGQFALARYLPDGTLDPAFGAGGTVTTAILGSNDGAAAVVVQPDGKLLAAGHADLAPSAPYTSTFALARYTPAGQLDLAFGHGGTVTTTLASGTSAYANALALAPDGTILVAGEIDAPGDCQWALARYLADGSLDTGFGTGGAVLGTFRAYCADPQAAGVAVQADGNIVVGGTTATINGENFALARFLPDGTLDPGFGSGGRVITSFSTIDPRGDDGFALLLQPDGKILLVGSTIQQSHTEFGLARYNPDGSLDSGFGSGGLVHTALNPTRSEARAVGLDRAGRIVAGGLGTEDTANGALWDFALARYLPDGQLDGAFGAGGLVQTSFAPDDARAVALIVQADDKPVLAGFGSNTTPPGRGYGVLTRYQAGLPSGCVFVDVCTADYFYTPVQYLVQHGVISGYADGSFRPYANTTRAQLVKIVVLGLAHPVSTPTGGQYRFADVPPNQPFFPYIETAAAAQIVSGYTCGGPGEPCDGQQRPYFRPGANVTRGQLAKLAVVAAGWPLRTPASGTFADVLPGSPFYAFVETASCHGIISGYACGGPGEPCDGQQRPYFRPAGSATRGQISKIVYLAVTTGGSTCAGGAAPR